MGLIRQYHADTTQNEERKPHEHSSVSQTAFRGTQGFRESVTGVTRDENA